MSFQKNQISANCRDIYSRIEAACIRSGRSVSSVRLIAVTKYAEINWVRELLELGVLDLGESRPQQLVERAAKLTEPVRWHLVGHLQRNKIRRVLPLTTLIHSIDSFRLLAAVDRVAKENSLRPRVLLEVNVSGEQAKHGFSPEELVAGWSDVLASRAVHVDGFMTMAPLAESAEQARPVFRRLRELRDQLAESSLRDSSSESLPLPELSMGMSRDFEVAIEEGATLVRIGSGLFRGLSTDSERNET